MRLIVSRFTGHSFWDTGPCPKFIFSGLTDLLIAVEKSDVGKQAQEFG